MIVFHPVTNKMLAELDVSADSFHYITLDGEDYLSLQVSTPTEIELPIGAYVNYNGVRYTLMQREAVRMVHTEQYDYTITLQSPTGYLSGYIVKLDTTHFSLTAQPRQHLQCIIDTLAMHGKQWSIGTCPDHQEITIEYKHIDCFSAIQEIARSLQWEYLLEHHTDGTSSISISPTIEYHRLDPLTLQYGYGKGLKSGIEVIPEEDGTPISTLYVTGTTRNIDASTYGSTALRLPRGVERTYQGSTYVTSPDGTSLSLKIAKGVYREGHFESTTPYPSREGHVSSVIAVDPSKFLFDFTDSSIPYTLDYSKHVLPKESMTVVFQTGSLTGVELEAKYTHQNRRFALVPKEQYGVWLPNADQLPKTGDRYAVYHISLPKEYIDQAEEDLLKEAIYHLHTRKDQQYTYRCEVDSSWASLNWESVAPRLTLGSCVTIGGLIKGTPSEPLRIIALKSYLHTPHAPEIELSNRSLPPERYPIPNFVLRNDNDLLSSIRDRLSWNLKLDERFIQKVTPNVTLNERYQLVVNDKIVSQKILKGADGKSVSVKDVVSAMQTNETVLDRVSKLLKSDAVFRQQVKGDTPKLSLNSQYQLVADDRIVSSVSLRGADAPPIRPNLLKLGNREGRFHFSNLDRGDGVAEDLFLLLEKAPQDYEGLVVSFYRTIKEIVPRTHSAFMYIISMLNNGKKRYLEAKYKVEDKGKRKKYELKFFHKVPKGSDVRLYYYENSVSGNETTVDVDFEELKVEALSAEDIETGRTEATAFIPHPDDLEGSGVESVEKEFALSSSKDSHPSNGWSATQPSWESGKYLWSRTKIVYKNPASTVYTGYVVSSEWEAINAIQIGDRNLLLNSGTSITNSDYELARYNLSPSALDLKEGDVVTLVIKGKLGEAKTAFAMFNSSGNVYFHSLAIRPDMFDSNGIACVTGTWRKVDAYAPQNKHVRIYVRSQNVTSESTIEWIKLVRGTTTSKEWTPALEDFEANIKDSEKKSKLAWEIYANTQAESARIAAEAHADGKITEEEKARIKATSEALQTAKEYAVAQDKLLKKQQEAYADGVVSESEKATLLRVQAEAQLAETRAKAYADGIVTEEEKRAIADAQNRYDDAVAKAKEMDDSIQIGSRNLFAVSGVGRYAGRTVYLANNSCFAINGSRIDVIEDPRDLLGNTIKVNAGSNLLIRGKSDVSQTCYYSFDVGSQVRVSAPIVDGVFQFSIAVPAGATMLNIGLGRYPFSKPYYLDKVMIVEGNKLPSDYTEAPEDVEARYQKLIANVDVEFALSTSMTVAPTSGWVTTAPAPQAGKYMWQRTKTILKDGSESIKGITCIQGADGRSIISVTEQYYHSTSMTALQGGSWSNTAPTPSDGKWIWTRSVIRFTVGDDTVTNAVCVTGEPGKSVSVDEVLTGLKNDADFGIRLADHVATLGGYVRSEDVDPKTTIVTIVRQGYKPMHVKLDSLTDADLGKRWEYAFRDRGTCVSTDGRVLVPPNCSIYDEGMHLIPSIGIDPDTGYNIVEAPIINACSNNRYSFYCIEFKGEMCYQFSNYGAIKIYDIGIQVNAADQKIASVNTILSNKATELEGHVLRLNNQAASMSASIYRLEHASPTMPVGSIMYTSSLTGGGKINMTHDKTSGNTLYLPAAVEGEHLKIWCNIWVNRSFVLGKSRSSNNLINTATGSDVSTLSLTKGHLYECIAINNETWIVTDLSR